MKKTLRKFLTLSTFAIFVALPGVGLADASDPMTGEQPENSGNVTINPNGTFSGFRGGGQAQTLNSGGADEDLVILFEAALETYGQRAVDAALEQAGKSSELQSSNQFRK